MRWPNCCTLCAYEKGGLAGLWKGGRYQNLRRANRGDSVLLLGNYVAYTRLSLLSLARCRRILQSVNVSRNFESVSTKVGRKEYIVDTFSLWQVKLYLYADMTCQV